MIDVSVFLPAIRVNNWEKMVESLVLSCQRHSWELIMCGPFDLPESLAKRGNIKMIIDHGSPSRCAQLASFECSGRLLYHCVDDALFLPDAIDQAIDLWDEMGNRKTIVNMKYREGQGYSGESMRPSYWFAHGHDGLRLPGIPQHFMISLHHLISAEYFREMGGYDCSWDYQNFNLHDLLFRSQADGAKVVNSPTDVTTCDHSQKDHKVIEQVDAEHDLPLFKKMYSDPDVLKKRGTIDLNNWTQQPPVWARRFKHGLPKGYEELVEK